MTTLEGMFVREKMIRAVRLFFEERHFHEVITPTLTASIPLEPTIYPFTTEWHTQDEEKTFFLSPSPERGIKKMLAAGIGKCFSLSKCFRNLESAGYLHNPEFLMLEWYREDATMHDIMSDVESLISFCAEKLSYEGDIFAKGKKWLVVSLVDLLQKHADIHLKDILSDENIREVAKQKGYTIADANWEQLFHQILLNEVEPHFSLEPFFLIDFPARISPLCAVQAENPFLAERFEFFIQGKEIGNGNTEGTNVSIIENYFAEEKKVRKSLGLVTPEKDESFLADIRTLHSKSYAGIGMGIDRLALLFSGGKSLRDVDPFSLFLPSEI